MSSPVTKIANHVELAQDTLLSQFASSPIINAYVKAIVDEIQRFEDVAYDVLDKRLLANATGDILDQIGKVVRVDRLGRTDDDYRLIIQVAIAANDSDGGAEQIIWIASQLVGADVMYTQEGTANFTLQYFSDDTLSSDLQEEALDLIGRAVPAGVQWRLIASEETLTGQYDVDTFGAGRYGVRIGGSNG
jgi:hypothetical protein